MIAKNDNPCYIIPTKSDFEHEFLHVNIIEHYGVI